MDADEVTAWGNYAQVPINLLAEALQLAAAPVDREDIPGMAEIGGFVSRLVPYIDEMVVAPRDHELYGHWRRLVATATDIGEELTGAAATHDLRPAAKLLSHFAEEIRAVSHLLSVARRAIEGR